MERSPQMRVAVIGAGVVGAAVARQLAMRGVEVTVFERDHPGAGTSGTTFGWINSHGKRPPVYHLLNVEGCEEHQRLAGERTEISAYVRTGNVEWAGDEPGWERLTKRVDVLDAAGYPAQWIDPARFRALEPDIRLPAEIDRVAYFPTEGYVFPALLIGRLLGEACDHGATLRCPADVRAIDPAADGVTVVTAAGRDRFDRVVSCVGRWTGELAESVGIDVRLVDATEPGGAAVGFLAYTAPVAVRLGRLLTTPGLSARPDGGGRLLMQALDLDSAADPAHPPTTGSALAATFAERLRRLLPRPEPVSIRDIRVGQRALPADGLPVVGYCDPDRRFYVAVTHSGMTLGPLLGRLVAAEVADDTAAELLADFRPGRTPTE